MKENYNFYNIIKSLSYAMDLVSKTLVGHHKRTAYVSYRFGLKLGLDTKEMKKLITASLIHDLGIFYLDQQYQDLKFDNESNYHAEVGYKLLEQNSFDPEFADIIKYHHHGYPNNPNQLSSIIHFADRMVVLILDDKSILNQVDHIKKVIENNKERFCPECFKIFSELIENEAFCLDIVSEEVISKTLDNFFEDIDWEIDLDELINVSKLISHITDFRSPFTAAHSQGIAAVAPVLAEKYNYSRSECKEIKAAAYLHDIGKLIVPTEILNKKGKPTKEEWNILKSHTYYTYQALSTSPKLNKIRNIAAYHHEKLDGTGYPFQIDEKKLSLSERIMAVADIFTAITEDRPYRKGMKKIKLKRF
ncbi:putative nucleotidyltransferase with HDIG domain [Halanaerobium sp. DL-01]|uniref:HD domain-containing phosphohydrolase n=1 Tax=Halanaerobium sp. DL-01 TaxID=1653064 RepID=UPI000DF49642|nr:HD domain-containing phosphohydrolase [Halanaerobium sp. DL-01]RCW82541.1 putative nucleotidyltransferase with HDIG domain [Halanaerobium sp. DL-01]